jgi:hypothetical protein
MAKLNWTKLQKSRAMSAYGSQRFGVEPSHASKEPTTRTAIEAAIERGEPIIRKKISRKMVFCSICGARVGRDELPEHGRKQHGNAGVEPRVSTQPGRPGRTPGYVQRRR